MDLLLVLLEKLCSRGSMISFLDLLNQDINTTTWNPRDRSYAWMFSFNRVITSYFLSPKWKWKCIVVFSCPLTWTSFYGNWCYGRKWCYGLAPSSGLYIFRVNSFFLHKESTLLKFNMHNSMSIDLVFPKQITKNSGLRVLRCQFTGVFRYIELAK